MKRLSLLFIAVCLLLTPAVSALQEDIPILSIGALLGSDKHTCTQYMKRNEEYFNGYYQDYEIETEAVDKYDITFFPNDILSFSGGLVFEFDDHKLSAIEAILLSDNDISMSNTLPTDEEVEQYLRGQVEALYRISNMFAEYYDLPPAKDVVAFDVEKNKWLVLSTTDEMVKLLRNADASFISIQYGNALLTISSLSGASNGVLTCPVAIAFFPLPEE